MIAMMLDSVLGLFGVFFVLLAIALYIGGAAWLAWWMLEPINRVAGHLQATRRFLLTDVIGLMVLLQLALATSGVALSARDSKAAGAYWLLLFATATLATVLWAAGVSVVSQAGIMRPLRRLAVMLLLIPGALMVIIILPILAIAIIDARMVRLIVPGCFGLAVAVLGIRRLSFWALNGSQGGAALAAMMAGQARSWPSLVPDSPAKPGERQEVNKG